MAGKQVLYGEKILMLRDFWNLFGQYTVVLGGGVVIGAVATGAAFATFGWIR